MVALELVGNEVPGANNLIVGSDTNGNRMEVVVLVFGLREHEKLRGYFIILAVAIAGCLVLYRQSWPSFIGGSG